MPGRVLSCSVLSPRLWLCPGRSCLRALGMSSAWPVAMSEAKGAGEEEEAVAEVGTAGRQPARRVKGGVAPDGPASRLCSPGDFGQECD